MSIEVIDQFSIKTKDGWHHTYLSNGFIEPDGTFVEREYQASKTLDHERSNTILACEKPFGQGGSKQLGRDLGELVRPDWDNVKFQLMAKFVTAKFFDHEELASKLIETNDALLIEGNTWHDNVWGDCRCAEASHPECFSTGTNWLGVILMTVRESLRQA
jgi:ribA/ribD-fused uncharacterized protein